MARLLSSPQLVLAWEDPLAELLLAWCGQGLARKQALVCKPLLINSWRQLMVCLQSPLVELLQLECLTGVEAAQRLVDHPAVQSDPHALLVASRGLEYHSLDYTAKLTYWEEVIHVEHLKEQQGTFRQVKSPVGGLRSWWLWPMQKR